MITSSIYIVMAVFRPNPEYLREQMNSLAGQTHRNFTLICVVADTCSKGIIGQAAKGAGLDPVLVMPEQELDAVRAFEAGLERAVSLASELPAGDEPLIALCDQDDIWHPDRLSRSIAALTATGADLVHSDAALVDSAGQHLYKSMFSCEHRHHCPGLRGLLYRNNITGMTTLFHLRLARVALPFPAQSGVHFYHDLWLGLLASGLNGVTLVRSQLVDYRQHGNNAIGAITMRPRITWRWGRAGAMAWFRGRAASYGLARYLAQEVHHRLHEHDADGSLSARSPVNTNPLRPFLRQTGGAYLLAWDAMKLALTGHMELAKIAASFSLVSVGRFVWSLRRAVGVRLVNTLADFDARLFTLSPGVAPHVQTPPPAKTDTGYKSLIDTRKTPRWIPDFSALGPTLTILVPTLNPTEIFAGIITALDIGLDVAAAGLPVRFIATDLPVSSYQTSRQFLLNRLDKTAGHGVATRLSLHCSLQEKTIPAHRDDQFLATAWWSAHVSGDLIHKYGFRNTQFYYLIQDYEPNFYPWGPEYADAISSYGLNFKPIFNTSLLRDYFAGRGFGFAGRDALTFHPAIDISRYASGKRPVRPDGTPPRLVLYGRPEVVRNMFTTAIETLSRFIDTENLTPDQIELVSVGLKHGPVNLPRGHTLNSLGKLPLEDYPGFLHCSDLGLSLMYSPHPSHLPLEMAAAGMRVVTNHFGPKDLSCFSPAIHSADPTPDALAKALSQAWHGLSSPLPKSARWIDLAPMGLPLDAMAAHLVQDLRPHLQPVEAMSA